MLNPSALLETAHAVWRRHAGPFMLDATAGNGHDTVFLAHLAGEGGLVLAVDRQKEALARTAVLLREQGLERRTRLVCGDHADTAALLDRCFPQALLADRPPGSGSPAPEVPQFLNPAAPTRCEGEEARVPWLDVAVFNLGFLPSSDKGVATRAVSTLAALDGVWPRLRPGGLLSVHAYVGHPGGADEAEAVGGWMRRLPWLDAQVSACTQWNKPRNAETLWLAVKNAR